MKRKVAQRRRRSGSVTSLLLISLAVLVGLLALNMDGGRMAVERRKVQNTADAAALAAAGDLFANYSKNSGADPFGTAAAAAKAMAQSNGYALDGTTSSLVVNIPPLSGPYAGKTNYVEVILTSNLKGSFGTFFTNKDLVVQRRATAIGKNKKIGILALANFGTAVKSSRLGTIDVDGEVIANSSGVTAISIVFGTLNALSVEAIGGINIPLLGLGVSVNVAVNPTPDPLAALPEPDPSACVVRVYAGGTATLQPGIYRGGISVSANSTVTLQPGLYIIDGGGITLGVNANIIGNGVTLFNTSITKVAGNVNLGGTGTVTLSPPTTGTYKGITIFQSASVSGIIHCFGNSRTNITGTIYGVNADVQIGGVGAGDNLGTSLIVKSFNMWGTGNVTFGGTARPDLPEVHCVE